MSPEPSHPPMVKQAIRTALTDIHLLRFLVRAAKAEDANAILTAFDPDLTLTKSDLQIFWISLTKGEMTMTAKMLVDHYDNLEPKPRILRIKPPPPQEWKP